MGYSLGVYWAAFLSIVSRKNLLPYVFQLLVELLKAAPFLGSWSSSSNFKAGKGSLSLHITSLKTSLLSLDFNFKDPYDYIGHPWIIQDNLSI